MTELAVRERLLVSVTDLLSALPLVALVERARDSDVSDSLLPALLIDDQGQAVLSETAAFVRYQMRMTVTIIAKASSGAALSSLLNELYAQTLTAIHSDPVLQQMALINEGDLSEQRVVRDASRRIGEMSFDLLITYETAPGNPRVAI
ncbi:hypothetical protein JCM17846_18480 [Iodidimonas nitroreducens]|uniref:Uncharacterized protein n=1 Tax=Iodidimonas nitroreducens TaxID=1236968 RepID=A0A5A7NB42_9PROT|nr:hypothetical protein [Iodidimonas nitroreducens]GAK33255.1 hypothetical protein AQ1_01142 [alpha proteobacterium Q-1]GER04166.1 hypothetical protein JCM17846_18480 [Iodidimonas nitroreducens]